MVANTDAATNAARALDVRVSKPPRTAPTGMPARPTARKLDATRPSSLTGVTS